MTATAAPVQAASPVAHLLGMTEPLQVVDVGANPVDGPPPYQAMLDQGLCEVVGFEPQPEALEKLQATQGPSQRYLPYALGDGAAHTLHVCQISGMSSLYRPDPAKLAAFNLFEQWGAVVSKLPVETVRLDDVAQIDRIDFLKIDVQGSELNVFRHGRTKLAQAVAVHTELSFVTLYEGQPSFGEVDMELRAQGFIPHGFDAVKRWPISPCVIENNPRRALNQLVECDLIYVRDFTALHRVSTDQLRRLALFAHHYCASFDQALRCLVELTQRQAVASTALDTYTALLAE